MIPDSNQQKDFYHLLTESTKDHGLETLIKYYEIDLSKMPQKALVNTLKPKTTITFEVFTKKTDILLDNSAIMTSSYYGGNEKMNTHLIIFFNSMLTYVNLSTGQIIFKKGKIFFHDFLRKIEF